MSEGLKTPAWLISLIEEHFDEAQMLWELRESGLADAEYHQPEIAELEGRLESHVDALVLAGQAAWPILEAGLNGDRVPAVAATLALLRQGQDAAELVLRTFKTAEGPALVGIGQGMCHSQIDHIASELKNCYESSRSPVAAVAAEVFAFHRRLSGSSSRLDGFLRDPDPMVRACGWRIVALVDG